MQLQMCMITISVFQFLLRMATSAVVQHSDKTPSSVLILAIILNLLSPKSDQHQISPCNSNALKNRVVMRITDMITQDQFT